MAHDVKICVTITCDRCLVAATADRPGTPGHWASLEDATERLLQLGWEAGPSGQVCPECVIARQCLQQGHEWGPWQHLMSLTSGADEISSTCVRCGHVQVASPTAGEER